MNTPIPADVKPMWTLEEALPLFREWQKVAHQHNVALALGGSVINNGQSAKDLDIIVLPFNTEEPILMDEFVAKLETELGVQYWYNVDVYDKSTIEERKVFKTWHNGRRIDWFFFLKFPSKQ